MQMMKKLLGTLALATLSSTVGCGGAPEQASDSPTDLAESRNAVSPDASPCIHDMRTIQEAVDISAPQCGIGQFPDLLNYVCADPTQMMVCAFFKDYLNGATLQCRMHSTPSGPKYCADVVNRDPAGVPLDRGPNGLYTNFLISRSPDIAYWDD